jgi:hypothetical protein
LFPDAYKNRYLGKGLASRILVLFVSESMSPDVGIAHYLAKWIGQLHGRYAKFMLVSE